MGKPEEKARETIDMASAGKAKDKGYRDDMVVGKKKGIFARGRGPGPRWGGRHR